MKNNKGFISMSLVYSFLIVFIAISTSLLAVYTQNIMEIRKLNNEIKEDLMKRGNNQIIILKNLMTNGSFEKIDGADFSSYWAVKVDDPTETDNPTVCRKSNKNPSGTIGTQVGQAYYGEQSLEVKSAKCHVYHKSKIQLKKGHVYYVERTYNAGNGYGAGMATLSIATTKEAIGTSSATTLSLSNFNSEKPFMSGWTMPTDSSMGTVDVDLFLYSGEDEKYYFSLDFQQKNNNQPLYIDGFMLIDVTDAVGDEAAAQALLGSATANAQKIWRLKAKKTSGSGGSTMYTTEGYFEGRKVFSALSPYSIK